MKKKYAIFLALLLAICAIALIACMPGELRTGPETGTYFSETDGVESFITLSVNNGFTFSIDNQDKFGLYTLDGTTLTFEFAAENEPDISATLVNDVISLTYRGTPMQFTRIRMFNVSFESNQGTAVANMNIMNGRSIVTPPSTTRLNHAFIGWYLDADFSTRFDFSITAVTSDIRLHARWALLVDGQNEFRISFDSNGGSAVPAYTQTIGGRVITPPPPTRANQAFRGWWISTANELDKLSYQLETNTVFSQDTTLFALWESTANLGTRLRAPIVRVDSTSARWDAIEGASSYRVEIIGPNGFSLIEANHGSTIFTIPFADAGSYTIRVTANHANSANNSAVTERHFIHRALARVSIFNIIDASSTFVFNPVENATRYILSIECGDHTHEHHMAFDNGNSTTFNFASCIMQEGGITFIVTAQANGFAQSVSRQFVHNKLLEQIAGLHVDASTDTVRWNPVPNATNYFVSINGGDRIDVGGNIYYSLKNYDAGNLNISVIPFSDGWNSPGATIIPFEKLSLRAPGGISVTGNILSWNAVSDAVSYEVRIDNNTPIPVTGTNFTLPALTSSNHQVRVIALGQSVERHSQWSNPVPVGASLSATALSYTAGVLTWNHVVGATRYEVTVNRLLPDQYVFSVAAGTNSAPITLTRTETNRIEVRSFVGETPSDFVRIDVFAFQISFNAQDGSPITTQYLAIGDPIAYPKTPTSMNFEFVDWYTSPLGGRRSNHVFFNGNTDIMLFGVWTGKWFDVVFNFDGGFGAEASTRVQFGRHFEFIVPQIDTEFDFRGWFEIAYGIANQYTNNLGHSIRPWTTPLTSETMNVYAYWSQIFRYDLIAGGTEWAIRAGMDISLIFDPLTQTGVVDIPAYRNGLPVTTIATFAGAATVTEIRIPHTIRHIDTTFGANHMLRSFVVCPNNEHFSSHNGILYNKDQTVLIRYPISFDATTFQLPAVVEIIGPGAFLDTLDLYEVTFASGSNLREIQAGAFTNSSVVITHLPFGLEFIMADAFRATPNLRYLTIPASVEAVGNDAFRGALALHTITFAAPPQGQTAAPMVIGENVFRGITVNAPVYNLIFEEGSNIVQIGPGAFRGFQNVTQLRIPNTIETWVNDPAFNNNEAFAMWPRLTNLVFEDGLKEIGNFAFSNGGAARSATNRLTINIPASVERIGTSAFAGNQHIEAINFGANSMLESIGNTAFAQMWMPNVTDIVLPENLIRIGDTSNVMRQGVFLDTLSIQNITLPTYLEYFDSGAFYGLHNLQTLTISASAPYFTTFNNMLFSKDMTTLYFIPEGLTGIVEIPEGVTHIAPRAARRFVPRTVNDFNPPGNNPITAIILPSTLLHIGNEAFATAMGNTTITYIGIDFDRTGTAPTGMHLPDGLLTIGYRAFGRMLNASMTTLSLPASLLSIGEFAFINNNALVSVSFRGTSNLSVIGRNAFQDNIALTSFEIPVGLETLGDNIFLGANNLANITVQAGNPNFVSDNGVIFDTSMTELIFAPDGIASFEVPNTVTHIRAGAFRGRTNLTSLTFAPNSTLVYIGERAFYNTRITGALVIPRSVEYIGISAFQGQGVVANNLITDITFESDSNLETIRNNAFAGQNNPGMISLHIPRSVRTIGQGAFSGINNLETLTFEDNSNLYYIGHSAFQNTRFLRTVEIPRSVRTIGQLAFRSAFILRTGEGAADANATLTFQSNSLLENIRQDAFSGNNALYSIEIPVYQLRDGFFEDGIGNNRTILAIEQQAFSNFQFQSPNVRHVTFVGTSQHNYNVSIGWQAFFGMQIESIVIPKSITAISVTGMSGVNITPDQVVIEHGQSGIFESCRNLNSITFEEGSRLRFIGSRAFENTDALLEMTLPASLEAIGSHAFRNSALETLNLGYGAQHFVTLDGVLFSGDFDQIHFLPAGRAGVFQVPRGLETIGRGTFSHMTGITDIIIPSTVTEIWPDAFHGLPNLRAVHVAEGNPNYASLNGVLYRLTQAVKSHLLFVPPVIRGEVVVPAGVGFIGSYMRDANNQTHHFGGFQNAANVERAVIPSSVHTFTSHAFSGAASLREIYIPNDSLLSRIGSFAFSNANSLETLFIPRHVTFIGGSWTIGGAWIGGLPVGTQRRVVTNQVFQATHNLREITVHPANTWFASLDGMLFSRDMTYLAFVPNAWRAPNNPDGSRSTVLRIPEGTRFASNEALALMPRSSESFNRIHLPSTMWSIGAGTAGATGLGYGQASYGFPNPNTFGDVFFNHGVGAFNINNLPVDIDFTSAANSENFFIDNGVLYTRFHTAAQMNNADQNARVPSLVFIPLSKHGTLTIPANVRRILPGAFDGVPRQATPSPNRGRGRNVNRIEVASGNNYFRAIDGILYSRFENWVQQPIVVEGTDHGVNRLVRIPAGMTGTITIPASITTMYDTAAWIGVTGITRIEVESGNTHFRSIDGVLFDRSLQPLDGDAGAHRLKRVPGGKTTAVTIPADVTQIFHAAWSYARIPAINVGAGNTAFVSNNGVLMNLVAGVGGAMISTQITHVPYGFAGVLNIPATVTSIVFSPLGTPNITSFNVAEGNTGFVADNHVLYSLAANGDKNILTRVGTLRTGELRVPATVTQITGLTGNLNITRIVIPSGMMLNNISSGTFTGITSEIVIFLEGIFEWPAVWSWWSVDDIPSNVTIELDRN